MGGGAGGHELGHGGAGGGKVEVAEGVHAGGKREAGAEGGWEGFASTGGSGNPRLRIETWGTHCFAAFGEVAEDGPEDAAVPAGG